MRGNRFGLVLVTLFALGWQSVAGAQPVLGEQTFGARRTMRPAVDASFRVHRAAVRSVSFRGRVGGVAFGEVAQPRGVNVESLSLRYDDQKGDGARLTATINGEAFVVRVPDWILLPAAEVAAEDQVALVTAFGEYADQEASERERKCNYIFSYHPAIDDNLMGLRLFQADLIGITDQYPELPAYGGTVALGAGERAPSRDEQAQWRRAHRRLLGEISGTYTSYLLTDADLPIVFTLDGGEVRLTGGPSYRPWRNGFSGAEAATEGSDLAAFAAQLSRADGPDIARRAQRIAASVRRQLQLNHQRDRAAGLGRDAERDEVAAEIDTLLQVARSPAIDLEGRKLALAYLETLRRSLDIQNVTGSPLASSTRTRAANPVVHDAVTRFAQVTALLRYVREHHAAAWQQFHRQVRGHSAPSMTLPTELKRPGC